LRLYLRQDAGNVASAGNVVFEKYGQVAFLGFIVESDGEVLWIYLPMWRSEIYLIAGYSIPH
jgi:hypothetical protein